MSLIDLSGRAALVTGGSRGIGAATAVMLAEAGADVALTYRTRKEDAERVARRIEGLGRRAICLAADLSRKEDCEEVVRRTVEAFGRLDIFVANAGIWPPDDVPVSEMSDEQWRTTMATNLDSVFYGTRAALRVMRPKSGARIVIVSSTAGQRGEAFHADYAATKGALISFVKSVAVEVAKDDITVNAVAPGWVDTEMSQKPYERDGGAGRREIERSIPLGRIASAEDVAGPIVFLCSSLARHITGEILNVNGGSVLCG
ncbi:MAG: beta-ketoacyl-ACP reductase [Gemmatimonadales bacterium]|nr:MAG: beta-ketoacyl-ACP reductase [Gemmatimonadales bacterium]